MGDRLQSVGNAKSSPMTVSTLLHFDSHVLSGSNEALSTPRPEPSLCLQIIPLLETMSAYKSVSRLGKIVSEIRKKELSSLDSHLT